VFFAVIVETVPVFIPAGRCFTGIPCGEVETGIAYGVGYHFEIAAVLIEYFHQDITFLGYTHLDGNLSVI